MEHKLNVEIMAPNMLRTHNFAKETADIICRMAEETLKTRSFFLFGLCGGNTPKPVYEELARRREQLDWKRIILTFGDERCVPPDSPQSNFRMAQEALISHVPIPEKNVHRMKGEIDPSEAAILYESELLEIAREQGNNIITHDLLLLGIGDDGHTASLFPGTEALNETEKLVSANFIPKYTLYRLTLTFKAINASRNICFLVNDPGKQSVVDRVLDEDTVFPASRVSAKENLTWIRGF